MNDKLKNNLQEFKDFLDANKAIKVAVYVGLSVVSLYIIGKVFSTLAYTVRGFNDLQSAINGK